MIYDTQRCKMCNSWNNIADTERRTCRVCEAPFNSSRYKAFARGYAGVSYKGKWQVEYFQGEHWRYVVDNRPLMIERVREAAVTLLSEEDNFTPEMVNECADALVGGLAIESLTMTDKFTDEEINRQVSMMILWNIKFPRLLSAQIAYNEELSRTERYPVRRTNR